MTGKDGNLFARFGFESSKISRKRVHFQLFEPYNGLLSVQTVDDLSCAEIKETGKYVGKEREGSLRGWAQITKALIEEVKLTVCINNNPNPGHADICGWPKGPEHKNVRKDKQKILAKKCSFVFIV